MTESKPTKEEIISALKKYKAEYTFTEISEMIGVNKGQLTYIYYCNFKERIPLSKEVALRVELGKWGKKITKEQIDKVIEMGKNKIKVSEITKTISISKSFVYSILKDNGIATPNKEQNAPTQILTLEGLVEKYKYNQDFNITPLFLIRTHNITPRLAAMVCEKLKESNG